MNDLFLQQMKDLLKDDFDSYLKTLDNKNYRGFRVNTLKISSEDFLKQFCIPSRKSLFAKDCFVLETDETYGHSLPHALGLMYMQEPSATSAVEVLDPGLDDWVLDLCGAPGGKSTQIAQRLGEKGLLVTNEIEMKRAQILLCNIERLGISNAIVTCSTPAKLSKTCKGFFDKILVDAPCSGEGMFKKESQALQDWSKEHVQSCAIRQRKLLDSAIEMLKENGVLVYSTCTYSLEENEETVAYVLNKFPEMILQEIDVPWGRKGFDVNNLPTSKCRRILPMDQGEGHFIAKFIRKSPNEPRKIDLVKSEKIPSCVLEFLKDFEIKNIECCVKNNKVYAGKHPFIELKENFVLRNQVCIGEITNNRFEPHQHFFTSVLFSNMITKKINLSEKEIEMFRKGNTLSIQTEKGYVGIGFQNHLIGFGKSDGTIIKNKIPKGLRIR